MLLNWVRAVWDERQLFCEIQLAKSGGRQVARVEHTLNPAQIDPAEHGAIFYTGGHGTMWDFADNQELAGIGAIYEAGGIVGAVCHGLAALVNLNFQVGVVASDRLVTGQNPASAAGVGHKMVESIKNK
ncbi:hypothetical protein QUA71_16825 [Microcoleus sp. MON1_C5]|uniref:hypothetical protein n=1 Tax=Microcoleus sp. MON1_C5 TaxID=2818828 RepID=UPI002FCF6F7D